MILILERSFETTCHKITSTMAVPVIALLLLIGTTSVSPFQPTSVVVNSKRLSSTSTTLKAWFPDEGQEAARNAVWFWFFGAAGSGGVARAAVPKQFDFWKDVQALKGVGPTKGGPKLGVSPLCGYPEDVSVADVQDIINNKENVERIVEKYKIESNYYSKKGYLTLDAWTEANKGKNPLAVRLVFDSFGKPSVIEPDLAQKRIDEYKQDIYKIPTNLIIRQLIVLSALFTLLFLLGLADVATATDAYRGFFPNWPGGQDFPWKLFTPEGSIFTIPDYLDFDEITK